MSRKLDECGETLTVAELAAVLGIGRSTIDRMIAHGSFPIPWLPALTKQRRWAKAVVRRWLDTNGTMKATGGGR